MSPYKIPLPKDPGYVSPFEAGKRAFKVEAVNDIIDVVANTRSLTLQITHPGLIWTGKWSPRFSAVLRKQKSFSVIAFDAHVLKWTLDDAPPNEYTRHHIKEASFFGVDRWSVDLVVQGTAPLTINFIGIDEEAMWPGKKATAAEVQGRRGVHINMELFERLDGWLTGETGDQVDTMLLATVGGVVTV
jgi:hypothetical protein